MKDKAVPGILPAVQSFTALGVGGMSTTLVAAYLKVVAASIFSFGQFPY